MKNIITVVIGVALIAIVIAIDVGVMTVAESQDRAFLSPKKELKRLEHLPYAFLFRHVAKLKNNKSETSDLKSKSGLNEFEFSQLVRVATAYQREISDLDAQAQVIIADFHRTYPPGRLPAGTGPGRAPQALIDLQNQRDQAAIVHRDQLKNELSADGGIRFEAFVDTEVRSKIASSRPVRKEVE